MTYVLTCSETRSHAQSKASGQDDIASANMQTHDAANTFKLKVVITYMKLELFGGSQSNSTIQFSPYSSSIV